MRLFKEEYERLFSDRCSKWQNIIAFTPEKYARKDDTNRSYRYVEPEDIIRSMETRLAGNTDGMRKKFIPMWERTLKIAKELTNVN